MTDILVIGAFVGGVLSFFSPCILPVLPVYISILAGENSEEKEKN